METDCVCNNNKTHESSIKSNLLKRVVTNSEVSDLVVNEPN